ncbi:L-aspartate oxidase [Pseudoxanthomonas koreensis]|uniref:L-aspartate oxidase n=1 Tax=Pseudoxanthomonas koreensis TaxID=266061 RepID=UPI001EE452F9|nr:FAD-binding protein [Pseudoxanthomonas koreensis]
MLLLARGADGAGSTTALAQGGIAVALGAGDSPAAHALDTLLAGAHHNHRAAVRHLVTRAPAAIARLQAQGLDFDRDGDGLCLGREGGHRAHRIVHAGGDASGARLVAALARAVRAAGHVEVRGGVQVQALLLRGGAIAGVRLRAASGRATMVETGDVVLATGGIGALFAATTNPAGADGSGLALGLAAGAAARDLEFVQFHPTALAVPATAASGGALPLVTEALRGAGARLYDDHGRRLMAGLHPLEDLAPRDLVARRVWQELRDGGRAWLDATLLGDAWPSRFPTVHAACRAHGIDPAVARIPITPAAHFHMGGLAVDLDGRTGVPGLHAGGEVACNGVHGANRLASNSLLAGLGFGHRIGCRLAGAGDAAPPAGGDFAWAGPGQAANADALDRLRALLWHALGPVRDAGGLVEAQRNLREDAHACGWQGRLASRLVEAALQRGGSLGAHWRGDAE